ncbi:MULTISPECIES: hypothetical protein [unclassified Sphingobacterium]|uniref:hypothetical protein n=1 Tax=unclassified Sphingobacterium TaxID=2609468 RepID=UPI0025F9B37B|nr:MULTISPECIES: hypothetical protein [unclassified Sphingobacterium]
MIQIRTAILLVGFLLQLKDVYAQSKKMEDNTATIDVHQESLSKKLGLSDLKKSNHEFAFRFWGRGQAIDIIGDSTDIIGTVTNYIYHQKKSSDYKIDILFKKASLCPDQAEAAYLLFLNLSLLNIPSDEKVKGWRKGADGITYRIEQVDQGHYSNKSYWTPSSQDGLPEAKVISDFVNSLSDTLKLEETFRSFKNTLPRKGCYHTGGMAVICYVSNSFWAGYSAATKLPYGFYTGYNAGYIGSTKVNLGASLQYNFSTNRFYHLNTALAKGKIFYEKANLTDYIAYSYQKRKINIENATKKFENHQLMYGLQLKNNFKVGGGIDYLRKEDNLSGIYLSASKGFTKPNMNAGISTSLFEGRTNYKIDLSKFVYFNSRFFAKGLSVGVSYEDFMRYRDVYFNIALLL